MAKARFDWDPKKDQSNRKKHGVSFAQAQLAFVDGRRVVAEDLSHSRGEKRYYCFGSVGEGILTVRFTYRGKVIRIFGAGYWRKGKRIYERENQIHRRIPRKP
ncbi:MAG: BrnT family toxin [Burkholderiales bacterium]